MDGSYNGFVFTCKEKPPVERKQQKKPGKRPQQEMVPLFAFSIQKPVKRPKKTAEGTGPAKKAPRPAVQKSVQAAPVFQFSVRAQPKQESQVKLAGVQESQVKLAGVSKESGEGVPVSVPPVIKGRRGRKPKVFSALDSSGRFSPGTPPPAATPPVAEEGAGSSGVFLVGTGEPVGVGVLSTPIRPRNLSLDFLASGKRRTSIFKTRRESLFGYDQIHNGSIQPSDFYKHSNDSQDTKARVKQVLVWIIKYFSNGHINIHGVSQERLQAICDAFIKKVPFLKISVPENVQADIGGTSCGSTENPGSETLYATQALPTLGAETTKWKAAYATVLKMYTLSPPLVHETTPQARLSMDVQRRLSVPHMEMVSFDATQFPGSPNEVQHALKRRLEELNTVLNSSRYFMFLSMEYTKQICASLVGAACSMDKPRANALLQILCRTGKIRGAPAGKSALPG